MNSTINLTTQFLPSLEDTFVLKDFIWLPEFLGKELKEAKFAITLMMGFIKASAT